jgi:DeoR/GlpR family transcriptional regulator of sugar metabolism
MFGIQRRNKILSILAEKKSILVNESAILFDVTEETIRRDLKHLEKEGHLMRIHGGALIPDKSREEAPLKIREGINITGKDSIGKKAAEFVNDGDTIILDASTSSLYVAKYIKSKKNLTVITNAERIIMELQECNDIKLISTGGVLRHTSLSYVGKSAQNSLENYYANKLFFSCKGFSTDRGITDSNEQESELRKVMITRSDIVILICDKTKFSQTGYVNTAKLTDINILITDSKLSEDLLDKIKKENIKVELA